MPHFQWRSVALRTAKAAFRAGFMGLSAGLELGQRWRRRQLLFAPEASDGAAGILESWPGCRTSCTVRVTTGATPPFYRRARHARRHRVEGQQTTFRLRRGLIPSHVGHRQPLIRRRRRLTAGPVGCRWTCEQHRRFMQRALGGAVGRELRIQLRDHFGVNFPSLPPDLPPAACRCWRGNVPPMASRPRLATPLSPPSAPPFPRGRIAREGVGSAARGALPPTTG